MILIWQKLLPMSLSDRLSTDRWLKVENRWEQDMKRSTSPGRHSSRSAVSRAQELKTSIQSPCDRLFYFYFGFHCSYLRKYFRVIHYGWSFWIPNFYSGEFQFSDAISIGDSQYWPLGKFKQTNEYNALNSFQIAPKTYYVIRM